MSPLTKTARPLKGSRKTTVQVVDLSLPLNNTLISSNVQSLMVYVVWDLFIPLLLLRQPMVSSASQYPSHVFRRRVMGT